MEPQFSKADGGRFRDVNEGGFSVLLDEPLQQIEPLVFCADRISKGETDVPASAIGDVSSRVAEVGQAGLNCGRVVDGKTAELADEGQSTIKSDPGFGDRLIFCPESLAGSFGASGQQVPCVDDRDLNCHKSSI